MRIGKHSLFMVRQTLFGKLFKKSPVTWKLFAFGAVLAIVIVFLLGRLIQPLRERDECRLNLSSIGAALVDYQKKHGSLPPAASVEAKPSLPSWRVTLLPLIWPPYAEIVSKYDNREPWDGPHNAFLRGIDMFGFYHCPSDPGPRNDTSYVGVVGAKTAMAAETAAPLPNDASNTIVLVETLHSDIPWFEPRDLSATDALRGLGVREPSISSRHAGGAFAVLADGHIRWLSNKIDPNVLQRMIEIRH